MNGMFRRLLAGMACGLLLLAAPGRAASEEAGVSGKPAKGRIRILSVRVKPKVVFLQNNGRGPSEPVACSVKVRGKPDEIRWIAPGASPGFMLGARAQFRFTRYGDQTIELLVIKKIKGKALCDRRVIKVKSVLVLVGPVGRSGEAGDALPPSVPPDKTRVVSVLINPALRGTDYSVWFGVRGGGGAAGSAALRQSGGSSVSEVVQLKESANLQVLGQTQTDPGHAGELRVVGTFADRTLAESPGFSVCAHPNGIRFSFLQLRRGGNDGGAGAAGDHWGPVFEIVPGSGVSSDSDRFADLDETELKEMLPNRLGSGFWAGAPVAQGGWVPTTRANPRLRDRHTISDNTGGAGVMAALRRAADAANGNCGQEIQDQFFVFRCKRCGAGEDDGVAVPNSGFRIQKSAVRTVAGLFPKFRLTVRKVPFAVGSVGGGGIDRPEAMGVDVP